MIFVFGSNEAGIHGAGAARTALMKYGARMNQGFGMSGISFAIPTKDWQIGPLPFESIAHYVERFIKFAELNPKLTFQVTALGTGLAGHSHKDIAKLFVNAPDNCLFDTLWRDFLPRKAQYWGTYP
jgi:hypothetical protein